MRSPRHAARAATIDAVQADLRPIAARTSAAVFFGATGAMLVDWLLQLPAAEQDATLEAYVGALKTDLAQGRAAATARTM